MTTLSEITDLGSEVLKKMKLEPKFSCDPNQSENLLFLSPLLLLEDYDLKKGGFKDNGAKKVLGRVTKDILEKKESNLFQVPEVVNLHMGYGKKSANKRGKMALTAEEGAHWMSFLDMSRFARSTSSEESTSDGLEEEEPMEVSFPTTDDTQTHDKSRNFPQDLVPPCNSGLQIPLKGRYILLFSILLMFFDKKEKKNKENHSDSEEAKIGPNKISDFMLFWIVPYLLHFNNRKVQEIKKHHEVRGCKFLKFVKKSTLDVISESFAPCSASDEHREVVLERYKDYYGTDKLKHKYELLETVDGTPLILVPIRYLIRKMPATLLDIGKKWRELGRTTLLAEFMNLFIKDRDMQEDFLYSLRDLKDRQGIDFAVLLPDEQTFNELIGPLQRESADYFTRRSQTGRSLIAPCTALLKDLHKDLTVCFSFIQGNRSDQVSSLFRAIGAHYVDHFTLVILHGLCHSHIDPDFGVGNLCGVSRARKCSFKGSYHCKKEDGTDEKKDGNRKKKDDLDFAETIGIFSETEFPGTYAQWEEIVKEDEVVKKIMPKTEESSEIFPKFIRDSGLTVMYATTYNSKKLCKPFKAALASNEEMVKNCERRVVNLNGCLLSKLSQCGRKDNIAVVLAIKDTCDGSHLPQLEVAIKRIITHFIRAVIVAGLPNVYRVERGEENRENIECDTSSDEDLDDDQVEQASSNTGQKIVKEGEPSADNLEALSQGIGTKWKPLARRLGFSDPEIIMFHKDNEEYTEKCYQMLLEWKQRNASSATYTDLYGALCHYMVGKRDLAEKLCCY